MMKFRLLAVSASALLLWGCGDTSKVDEIASAQTEQTQDITTKSPSSLADPIYTTTSASSPQNGQNATISADGPFDIDLTQLSASMIYGQVYDMVYQPENYIGQIVKMRGPFAYYHDESTENDYFAVLITDAQACCSQGIEFVLEGEHTYPDDYPAINDEITVIGRFNSYTEGNIPYCQLTDAQIIE